LAPKPTMAVAATEGTDFRRNQVEARTLEAEVVEIESAGTRRAGEHELEKRLRPSLRSSTGGIRLARPNPRGFGAAAAAICRFGDLRFKCLLSLADSGAHDGYCIFVCPS
jgi:hypothetical protein